MPIAAAERGQGDGRGTGRGDHPLQVAVIAAALLTVPLTVVQEQGAEGPLLTLADWLIWSVFLVDLLLPLWFASDRRACLRRQWLSVAVVVLSFPAWAGLLELVRLARLTRLLRFVRLSAVAPRGLVAVRRVLWRRGMISVAAATTFLIFSGAALLALLEPEVLKGGFWDGVWWGVVTATTVGYGDIIPQSVMGRLIGVAIMLAGVVLFSTLAASTAAFFIDQDDEENLKAVVDRLDQLSVRLDRIEQALATKGEPPQPPAPKGGE